MPFFAASEAPPRPESMKFPVFSLLAGNLEFSETSSQLTPPSTSESIADGRAELHNIIEGWAKISRSPSRAGDRLSAAHRGRSRRSSCPPAQILRLRETEGSNLSPSSRG